MKPHRNIELKARDTNRKGSLAACESLGAEDRGVLVQRDTYFKVAKGRLKLREEEDAVSHLIVYERPDLIGERESRYRIIEVAQAEELKAALAGALGVKVVVAKERRLFLWRTVRIHLDAVQGLGDFIEFEAMAAPGSDLAEEEKLVAELRRAFAVDEDDLIGGSYCDLAMADDAGEGSEQRKDWPEGLAPGSERHDEFTVEGLLLTDVGGTISANVLSTPGMIAMMEGNATALAYEHLPAGQATVGFEVCVKHVAAAGQGAVCQIRAILREVIEGRKLRFEVEVSEGERTIGLGTHERRVIEVDQPDSSSA